jgi:uncharacterized membrane protein
MASLSRLRLIFILSLVILAGVFIATLYLVPSGQSYPEPRKAQIIDAGDEWILQYDITNNEKRDIEYTIYVTIDNKDYTDSTIVKQGKTYTYIHHIYPQQLTEGEVSFALYEEGKPELVEYTTYYIDLD